MGRGRDAMGLPDNSSFATHGRWFKMGPMSAPRNAEGLGRLDFK
jgi:hypothetical protein